MIELGRLAMGRISFFCFLTVRTFDSECTRIVERSQYTIPIEAACRLPKASGSKKVNSLITGILPITSPVADCRLRVVVRYWSPVQIREAGITMFLDEVHDPLENLAVFFGFR